MSEYNTKKPEEKPYMVRMSDYMGEAYYIAEFRLYKDKSGKGRWMKRNSYGQLVRCDRKEYPEAWRELTRDEFMDYHGLGEEDMRNDHD